MDSVAVEREMKLRGNTKASRLRPESSTEKLNGLNVAPGVTRLGTVLRFIRSAVFIRVADRIVLCVAAVGVRL